MPAVLGQPVGRHDPGALEDDARGVVGVPEELLLVDEERRFRRGQPRGAVQE